MLNKEVHLNLVIIGISHAHYVWSDKCALVSMVAATTRMKSQVCIQVGNTSLTIFLVCTLSQVVHCDVVCSKYRLMNLREEVNFEIVAIIITIYSMQACLAYINGLYAPEWESVCCSITHHLHLAYIQKNV